MTRAFRGPGFGVGNAPGVVLDVKFDPSPFILMAEFDRWGLDIRSFHEPLKRCVQRVVAPSIRENFDAEGRPSWPALSDATLVTRFALGFEPGPILNRTGTLKAAAQQLNIWTIDRERAFVSNLPDRAWYGVVHQNGSDATVHIPSRPFLLIQAEDVNKMSEVFADWMMERAVRSAVLKTFPRALFR